MPNYQNAKIYAVKSPNTDKVYIGSTTASLKDRFYGHKRTNKKTTSKEIIEAGEAFIELIELFPCQTRQELHKREGEIIRLTETCINKCVAGCGRKATLKKYYQRNREKELSRLAEYRKNNKAKRAETVRKSYLKNKHKTNQRQVCPCGGFWTQRQRKKHFETKRHKKYLETVNII